MPRKRVKELPIELQRLMQLAGARTLKAFAEHSGVTLETVRTWDRRNAVPLGPLHELAKHYGVPVEQLTMGADAPNSAAPAPNAGSADFIAYSPTGGVATVMQSKEVAAPWLVNAAPAGAGIHPGDAVPPPSGLGASVGALLPAWGARGVRPLLLSLPLGEQGSQRHLEYEVIPRHVRVAGAGGGAAAVGSDADELMDLAGDLAFSFEWLRQNLGHTSGNVSSIKVRGDSMAPTLLDGETIMIDRSVDRIEVDGIYVIEVCGRRMIKRVQHLFDGTLVLISDNTIYARESIPRDRARDVRVIGRMIWPRVR